MNNQEAKAKVDRVVLVGRVILGCVSALVIGLTILKIGTDNDWVFLRDFGRPLSEWHIGLWRDIFAAIVAGVSLSFALSFSIRYVAIRNVLSQLFQDNSTHIGSQDNSSHHYTSNYGSDSSLIDEVNKLREYVQRLEQLLADKQADPEHLRQLREFLEYAQNERILELKEQLAKDAEIFEKLGGLMSQLSSESGNAAIQAQNVLARRR